MFWGRGLVPMVEFEKCLYVEMATTFSFFADVCG